MSDCTPQPVDCRPVEDCTCDNQKLVTINIFGQGTSFSSSQTILAVHRIIDALIPVM